ncbi:MAG: SDR family NAD(P)-dependent oxidoreductase [Myxococcota bacterium]
MDVRGRVAVVTGAAGGIGAATAAALAARGARLVLADVDAVGLERVGAAVGALSVHRVDVSDAAAVSALAEEVGRRHGGAHVLVNNAGVTVLGTFEEHDAADWARVMGVNFNGVLNGCRAFLPQLRGHDRGWIVNISSLFGLVGVPGQTAYCASKYAVRGLSEALYEELRGGPVGLSVVHPGGVKTRIVEDARLAANAPADDATLGRLKTFFQRRAAPPDRVADAIVAAITAERHRVLVCPETTALDLLRRLSPGLGNRLAVLAMERTMGLGGLRARLSG